MSALLIDLPVEDLTTHRWVHVEDSCPAPVVPLRRQSTAPASTIPMHRAPVREAGVQGAPVRPVRPDVAGPEATRRVSAVRESRQASGLRLTRRGLAVVVGSFVALMATSATVVVTSFLSVSNDPVAPEQTVEVLRG